MKKSKRKVKTQISRTTEDLAEALNLPKSVSLEWEIRYEVTEEIIKLFNRSHMTVTELAKKAETSRARITRILKKDTDDISLDVLFRILGSMGQRVTIKFERAA